MNIITTRSPAIPIPFTHRAGLALVLTLWFAWLGPLIGGAPYNLTIMLIPFSYAFGFLPALFCGLLYGLSFMVASRLRCHWAARTIPGAACGAAGCAITSLLLPEFDFRMLATHGVPAGAVCAMLYQNRWIDARLSGTRVFFNAPTLAAFGATGGLAAGVAAVQLASIEIPGLLLFILGGAVCGLLYRSWRIRKHRPKAAAEDSRPASGRLARISHRFAKRGPGDAGQDKARAESGAQAYLNSTSSTRIKRNAGLAGRSGAAAGNR